MRLRFEEIGRTEGPHLPDIPGLAYFPEFISAEEAAHLLSAIDEQPWMSDLKRRVQHYGYRYDYRARAIGPEAGNIPSLVANGWALLLNTMLRC